MASIPAFCYDNSHQYQEPKGIYNSPHYHLFLLSHHFLLVGLFQDLTDKPNGCNQMRTFETHLLQSINHQDFSPPLTPSSQSLRRV